MISVDQIKELREKTGISIGQCKKALEEASGDIEKAVILLSKKGADVAAKKSGRELKSGVVEAYIHGGKVGAMVELRCETDFVAKNEEFKKLAYDIAMQVAATNPTFKSKDDIESEDRERAKGVFEEEVKDKPEEMRENILEGKLNSYFKDKVLLDQDFIKNSEKTIEELIQESIQKFGEKIEIEKIVRFEV